MTLRLLDTDIMIDIERAYPAAIEWIDTLDEAPGLPGFVAMELIQDRANKQEVKNAQRRIAPFALYWPTEVDAQRALATFAHFHLSHGLGLMDALIGETAVGFRATLCTFNTKHFGSIPGLVTEQPYQKSTFAAPPAPSAS